MDINKSTAGLSLLLAGLLLSGCTAEASSSTGGAAKPGDCAKLAEVPPDVSAATVALVVDNTASGVQGPVPSAVLEALTTAQERGDQLAIVPVDGAGKAGRISRTVALDPYPGKEADTAKNARKIALQCVGEWMREAAARPTAPGSDILTAVTTASREKPTALLVVSDGLTSAGEFDLNRTGFDDAPDDIAADLVASGSLAPSLRGTGIVWSGLGTSTRGLPQSLVTAVQGIWTAVLKKAGATAVFDPRTGGTTAPITGPLPADDLTIPDTVRSTTSCGEQIVVPSALLFSPGSADLHADADPIAKQAADALTAHPDWIAIVEGHTASYDTAAVRKQLSQDRAQAVVTALTKLTIAANRLQPKGYGATKPAVPEFSNGKHDRAAAAKNRRVVVNLGPKGCLH
ncbi:OmpA family protein [Actinoplanes awajinensis]|uniref:OmpA-like domain-containing protein n=1 Tax=Actinoplanes awajinensis subsp. mycoplanecinus TaxID=135947 RepID=A0A0X3V9E2_9ACTN|nr:OmpA family protein [Actinoplanes awajinensis]KUL41360.1 hypothetical protein ADL15_03655 [Actinoplanes awajinensis subsp. mycoplanecinus]